MDQPEIAAAFPELVLAAEGPVMDTSCAALMKLAAAVHGQGYKVALTGEGADEALAGYVWFKTQAIRDADRQADRPRACRSLVRRFLLAADRRRLGAPAPLYGDRRRPARPSRTCTS